MKRKFSSAFLVLLCTSVFLSACHHDKVEPNVPKYRLTKFYAYDRDNQTLVETSTYTYSGTHLSREDMVSSGNEFHYTFDYQGEQMVKRSFYTSATATAALRYDTIIYNTDGTYKTIEHYSKVTDQYIKNKVLSFSYTAGKISKVTVSGYSNGNITPMYSYSYTYTGNNVSSVTFTSLNSSSQTSYTLTFNYDTNVNYFKNIPDYLFISMSDDGEIDDMTIPLLLSGNNLTTIIEDNIPTTLSYILDEHQNLKQVKLNGKLAYGTEFETY